MVTTMMATTAHRTMLTICMTGPGSPAIDASQGTKTRIIAMIAMTTITHMIKFPIPAKVKHAIAIAPVQSHQYEPVETIDPSTSTS
jgi:hypothetical protein